VRYDGFALWGKFLLAGEYEACCRHVIAAWVLQWRKSPRRGGA